MAAAALEQSKALFVRRWGEMGIYWGINRTMAEIHALLYISEKPLCTDNMMEQLQISRGNASMNIRGLVDWGLVRRIHHRGDRKQYFICETDVWQMFATITRERKRREVEPIIDTIRRCCEMIDTERDALQGEQAEQAATYHQRLANMLEFLNTMNQLINLILKMGGGQMAQLSTMLGRLAG
jgi:HTH-type transcriptional regulator, glycine betaine synthesis regulator